MTGERNPRAAPPSRSELASRYVLKADPSVRVTGRAHKMSKSRGNVVNPDDVVADYGALRVTAGHRSVG